MLVCAPVSNDSNSANVDPVRDNATVGMIDPMAFAPLSAPATPKETKKVHKKKIAPIVAAVFAFVKNADMKKAILKTLRPKKKYTKKMYTIMELAYKPQNEHKQINTEMMAKMMTYKVHQDITSANVDNPINFIKAFNLVSFSSTKEEMMRVMGKI